ncbi:endonuclease domain-containing protein [Micromonospora tulbaghiae]|uniref:endonuclease domain-containing protein n=1 Tax=Micromonospora tulbaghiae TaxID=479978 RepID=UPI003319CABF
MADHPACWRWPVPPITDRLTLPPPIEVLYQWQADRCALCGIYPDVRGSRLLLDHDHATGLVRGLLCTACNTMEGIIGSEGPVFANYRQRPPAAILAMAVLYSSVTGHQRDSQGIGPSAPPTTDSIAGWLDELRRVEGDRRQLDIAEARLIERAREDGATWEQVGLALGYSPSAATSGGHARAKRLHAVLNTAPGRARKASVPQPTTRTNASSE